jgi:dolichol kinase
VTPTGFRRLIHASTPLCLLVGVVAGWPAFRLLLTALVPAAAMVELWRVRTPSGASLPRLIPVFRATESRRPSGAFWLVLGYAGAAWFGMPAAAAGVLVGGLADPVASAVGSRWGGLGGGRKTWIGSAAAFACALVIGLALRMTVTGGVVMAVVAAALERWPGPFDDNLVLAPGVAAVVAAFSLT